MQRRIVWVVWLDTAPTWNVPTRQLTAAVLTPSQGLSRSPVVPIILHRLLRHHWQRLCYVAPRLLAPPLAQFRPICVSAYQDAEHACLVWCSLPDAYVLQRRRTKMHFGHSYLCHPPHHVSVLQWYCWHFFLHLLPRHLRHYHYPMYYNTGEWAVITVIIQPHLQKQFIRLTFHLNYSSEETIEKIIYFVLWINV